MLVFHLFYNLKCPQLLFLPSSKNDNSCWQPLRNDGIGWTGRHALSQNRIDPWFILNNVQIESIFSRVSTRGVTVKKLKHYNMANRWNLTEFVHKFQNWFGYRNWWQISITQIIRANLQYDNVRWRLTDNYELDVVPNEWYLRDRSILLGGWDRCILNFQCEKSLMSYLERKQQKNTILSLLRWTKVKVLWLYYQKKVCVLSLFAPVPPPPTQWILTCPFHMLGTTFWRNFHCFICPLTDSTIHLILVTSREVLASCLVDRICTSLLSAHFTVNKLFVCLYLASPF